MYGTGQAFEGTIRAQLQDLAFIDAREAELDLLGARGSFGALGAWGALAGVCRAVSDHTDQLASIYARVAAQLGYLAPARRLTRAEWDRARDVEDWVRREPRLPADVERRFGAPSYKRSGQSPRVLGYAGPDDDAWLYFDFSDAGDGDRLEYVRLPRHPFAASVVDLSSGADDPVSPEDVYRRFLVASLSGDMARILPLLVSHEDPAPLWAGAYPADVASLLAETYEQMHVVRATGEMESVVLLSEGCPVPLTMVRDGETWRVDADPLLRFLRPTAAERKQRGGP